MPNKNEDSPYIINKVKDIQLEELSLTNCKEGRADNKS